MSKYKELNYDVTKYVNEGIKPDISSFNLCHVDRTNDQNMYEFRNQTVFYVMIVSKKKILKNANDLLWENTYVEKRMRIAGVMH